ncbi:MAG: tetratricopeptide repeat protein [Calditrichaceae bacterium]|nr:tetratricopeptide repeat protein [Calditrichaceae bacterium]
MKHSLSAVIILPVVFFSFFNLYSQNQLDTGIKLFESGKFEEAKAFFLTAYDKNKKDAQINFYLGRCYLMLKDFNKAVDFIEEAVELDEKNVMYHIRLGEAYGAKAQNSNMFKAVWLASKVKDQFERAYELDPNDLGAQTACASFYVQAPSMMGGDLDKAKKIIQQNPLAQNRMVKTIEIDIVLKEENYPLAQEKFAEFDSTYNDSTDHYSFYNRYGYFLINQKAYDKAIRAFTRQIELAPDEANPYDSLGDAYQAAGNIAAAIAQYKKALEIDPEMKVSQEKLEKLMKD